MLGMTRIAALNDWSVGSSEEEDVGPTREALEAQANKDYNEAIVQLAHHNLEKAHENFNLVLQNPYVEKACWPDGVKPGGTLPQDVALRYSCLKNLGNLCAMQGDHEQATKHYLEAVQLDNTEVTVWLRLGASAIKLKDFELALVAFQEGLLVNPKHWPCLDQLLSVLFILEMYMDCLGLIISALKRDPHYTKANAFKDKIFELQPSLVQDVKSFYCDSDVLFHNESYDHTLGDKFIKTCELLRPPCKTPRPPSPFQLQHLKKPLTRLSWDHLAESLIATYDDLVESEGMAFASRIDVHEALKVKEVLDCVGAQKSMEVKGSFITKVDETNPVNGSTSVEGTDKLVASYTSQENKYNFINSNTVDLSQPVNREASENEKKISAHKSPNTDDRKHAPVTELTDTCQGPRRIPSRRQTIELGESQDSFRVSEKRRSVDSDTFSHPDDELRTVDEGVNLMSEKTHASVSSKEAQGIQMTEKNEIRDHKDAQDVGKIASDTKDPVEVGLGNTSLGHCKSTALLNMDQSSCRRTITEVANDTSEDPERKKRRTENICGKNTSDLPVAPSEEKSLETEEQSEFNINLQEKIAEDGTVSRCRVQSNDKDRVYHPSDKTEKENDQKSETLCEQMQEKPMSYEANKALQRESDISEQMIHSGFQPDHENRNSETTSVLSNEVEKMTSVSRALYDQEEIPATDPEEDQRENYLEDVEGAEGEQEEGEDEDLRENEEEEDGLEDEAEDEEGEDEDGGLLTTEVTETEAAVNALKGIMGLQPTEILGLPEPEYDYDNDYAEYFDGGVYEEDDEEVYHEEQEGEDDEMVQEDEMEGMEQVEGLEQEGLESMEEIEQEDVTDQVERMSQAGVEQDEEADDNDREQEEELNRQNEDINENNIGERDIDEAIAEQLKSIQKDGGEPVTDIRSHEVLEQEERLDNDGAEEARTDQERLEEVTSQKADTEQAEHSKNQNESKKMHPEEAIRQEEFEQQEGDAVDLEDNGADESEYREDDQEVESQQKENQNEEELEARSVMEKRNSTEDDTIQQETDTEAEGSKMANVDKDESNKESCGSRDTTSKTIGGDNTPAETCDKAGEGKTVGRVGRKPKRHKRGLERELEQLDYWGRRQERDAKRRRRTISSKLLGTIEETEYLTWGDLLRSFIPTSLLTCNDDKDMTKLLQQNLPTGKSDERSSYCGLKMDPSDAAAVSASSVANTNTSTMEKGGEEFKNQNGSSIKSTANEETIEGNKLEEELDVDLGKRHDLMGEREKEAGNSHGRNELEKFKEGSGSQKLDDGHSDEAFKRTNADKEKSDVESVVVMEEKNDADADKNKNYAEEDRDKPKTVDAESAVDVIKKRDEVILSPHVTEEEQVEAFLLRHENNGGILDLLQPLLIMLWKRHTNIWPVSAAKIFTEVYPRVRNHVRHGEALDLSENRKNLYEDSMLAFTHWELMVSLYHTAKLNTPPSEQRNLVNPFSQKCEHLEDDLMQLTLMLGRGDIWMAETPQIHTRLRWLQAQVKLGQDQPEQAVSFLHLLMFDLEHLSEGGPEFIVEKAHVNGDPSVVSHSEVRRHLNFLQRSHMLEQVVDNYTDGRYQVVAELLTTIFHEPPPKSRQGVTLPTRQTQLAILVDSLFKLKDYKGVITWGAQGLAEALMRFNRAEAEEEKNRWAKTLMKISETMNTTLEHHITIMDEVERVRVVQLVTTLISMLVIQLEKSPNAQVLPFETLSPWMLLHRMLAHEEQLQKQAEKDLQQEVKRKDSPTSTREGELGKGSENQKASPGQDNSATINEIEANGVNDKTVEGKGVGQEEEGSAESEDPVVLYPSTLFLITAHDELGKHSWCAFDEGVLLLYCLDVLVEEGQRGLNVQHRQLLHHTLEQVSFCLYSHPSKKSKHKHLRDHGVTQIALCWDRALQLYRFYCPPQLPDFQSSQIPSITDDVAALFKRIIALFPDENQPENHVAAVEAYINGEKVECKYAPISPSSDVVRDCFYLLGDYYFKNKEWNNAIKYYKLDLTINSDRLESWAPLGLAMKAILETQLNSCEVIQDLEEFFAMAQAGVRCLHQALQLDEYHTNLWVEFGGLLYMVHSHASRLLKQDLNPDISLEMFELLEKLKGDMLNKAEQCFTKALDIQEEGWDDDSLPDERWLHCYMLGKVSEKQSKPPETILQYYLKASEHLHNIHAKYPNKINYNSPQEYSVEALEMYYRPHVYILKYLQQREGKSVDKDIVKVFTKFLDKFAKGPFACCKEWKSTVGDKTDACGDDIVFDTDANTFREDHTSQKRKREDEDHDKEPVVKKTQMTMQSEDKMDIIKDVINELIHDAVELASQRDGKESEGTDELENGEGVGKVNEGTGNAVGKERRDSDDDIQVVEEKVIEKHDHIGLIGRCITALKLCLSRFPQHYKSLYRLAYYYNNSKYYKDCNRARNYLLGCDFWQRVGYMPVNGLFYERKVWIQQPRNCNFFHGVWRIPNDEVDRPGSFAAHMYRCVSLTLDVLPQVKDFYSILQIALALKNSPEKDKKYLRDNERELLSEHATQVGLQTMKDKHKILFKDSSPIHGNRRMAFLLDVFRSYKQISRHLPGSEPHLAKMLTDSYASYRGITQDNRANILREADAFCTRNQHLQHRITTVPSPSVGHPSQLGQSGQSSTMTGVSPVARRGRPPGTGRGRGRGRGTYFQARSPSNLKAIQEAYKLYENLLRIQTLISGKTLDQAGRYAQQKELEYCQAELLKYLRIPCVSQYFQSTLQGNTPTAKLPPPQKVLGSATTVSPSQAQGPRTTQGGQSSSSQTRPALSALAARSQAHGISITSVLSKPCTTSTSTPVKPSMSVTVSPVKTSCPPALQNRGEISVISVSRSSTSSKTTPSPATTSAVSKPTSNSSNPPSTTASTSRPSSPKPVSLQSSSSITTTSQANSSVPKLPAGTTLTRPRDSPNKSSGPRPQLQAQARPAKAQNTDSALDGLSSPMRKVAAEIMSNTSTSTAVSGNSGNGGKVVSSGQANKPSLPKGMTITPAPRVKSKALVTRPPVTTTQSSSYLGAYQASLGLGGNKPSAGRDSGSSHSVSATVIRGEGRSMPTSPGSKQVTQLSTAQLMQLAYGRGSSPGNISGLLNQISKKQPVAGQSRHPGSTPQRFPAPSLQRPQPNSGQRGTQPRPGQQIHSPQIRQQSPNKPPPKSGQDKNESSDDIITLD